MSGGAILRLVGPSLAVVLIWFGAGWLPAALSTNDERRMAAADERQILVDDLETARGLTELEPKLDGRVDDAAVAVPATVEIATFVRATGAAGDKAEVFIEQMAPLTVSSDEDDDAVTRLPGGTSSVTISIGARGGYEQVMAFVDALLALDRLVVIDLIDMTADEEDTGQLILDLELRIFTTEQLLSVPELDEDLLDGDLDEEGLLDDDFEEEELAELEEAVAEEVAG